MKTIYVARKDSYRGTGFTKVFGTLDELKRAIVKHTYQYEESLPKYSEELFKECATKHLYSIYKIELHDDEYVAFQEYEGESWFTIRKKDVEILSTSEKIEV